MERAPDEIIIHILRYLSPKDIRHVQQLKHRFYRIARDNNLWKRICFENSKGEATRRRQELLSGLDAGLVALREAIVATPASGAGLTTSLDGNSIPVLRETSKIRALANWDPSYPGEKVSFYNEYIQRHAPITLRYLEALRDPKTTSEHVLESVGAAVLEDQSYGSHKLCAPLEDGSMCIYDIGSDTRSGRQRTKVVHRTAPGLLELEPRTHSWIRNQADITDNFVIDSINQKAYAAMWDSLNEIDLTTMTVTRRDIFPDSITALSTLQLGLPMTVATYGSLQLFDPREPLRTSPYDIKLIAGAVSTTNSYSKQLAPLPQPGATSIAHSSPNSIYIAGRFTSILAYDRRHFPRLSHTIFSGARLSSMICLPIPYIPRSLDLLTHPLLPLSALSTAKAGAGMTLIASGSYKGKGSLELYSTSEFHSSSDDTFYRNRQTAAKSRLLSASAHGTRIVYSDGDGNLKWVERDGSTAVRSFNVNTDGDERSRIGGAKTAPVGGGLFPENSEQSLVGAADDIVRKIIPRPRASVEGLELSSDDFVVWTGDGRLGLVGFGRVTDDKGREEEDMFEAARSVEVQVREREERRYGQRLREVLEMQAQHARLMPGLGLGLR